MSRARRSRFALIPVGDAHARASGSVARREQRGHPRVVTCRFSQRCRCCHDCCRGVTVGVVVRYSWEPPGEINLPAMP